MFDKINYNFSILFDGTIWRILPDETNHSLALEVRNTDLHQTTFYSLLLQDTSLTELVLATEEQWWLGLQAAYKGCILLHGFTDQQNPVPHGLYCYAAQEGHLRWQSTQHQYFGLLKNQLLAIDTSTQQMVGLDLDQGTVIATYNNTNKPTEDAQVFANERNKITLLPLHYHAKHAYFDIISAFIKQKTGNTAIEAADYLEFKDLVILSYYIYGENKLENRILVCNTEGVTLLDDSLALNLSGIGLDTFFLLENQLIFIKNKNELCSYEIL